MVRSNGVVSFIKSIAQHFTHFLAGFIAGSAVDDHPVFSVTLTFLFLIYEYSERQVIGDKMFPEVMEYTFGYVLGWMCFTITKIVLFIIF